MLFNVLVFRARLSEARIQQMLWKVNYSDIIHTVCVMLLLITACAVATSCCISDVSSEWEGAIFDPP